MKSWSRNYTTVISTTTMTFQLGTSTLIPVETITAFGALAELISTRNACQSLSDSSFVI
jgi:hypothetical protein